MKIPKKKTSDLGYSYQLLAIRHHSKNSFCIVTIREDVQVALKWTTLYNFTFKKQHLNAEHLHFYVRRRYLRYKISFLVLLIIFLSLFSFLERNLNKYSLVFTRVISFCILFFPTYYYTVILYCCYSISLENLSKYSICLFLYFIFFNLLSYYTNIIFSLLLSSLLLLLFNFLRKFKEI